MREVGTGIVIVIVIETETETETEAMTMTMTMTRIGKSDDRGMRINPDGNLALAVGAVGGIEVETESGQKLGVEVGALMLGRTETPEGSEVRAMRRRGGGKRTRGGIGAEVEIETGKGKGAEVEVAGGSLRKTNGLF